MTMLISLVARTLLPGMETEEIMHLLEEKVYSIAISDNIIAAGISDPQTAKIWNTDGKLLHILREGKYGMIDSIAISNNIVVTGTSGDAKIWNTDGKLLHTIRRDFNYEPIAQ